MKKLNIQNISDSNLDFKWNDHIALFNDFSKLKNIKFSDFLVEGFLFVVVTRGTAQLFIENKEYRLETDDVFTCKPRNIFEGSMMSLDFDALTLFVSPEYVAQLSGHVRMEWSFSMLADSHRILHASKDTIQRFRLYFDLLLNHLQNPGGSHKEHTMLMLFASMAYEMIDLHSIEDDEEMYTQTYSAGEYIFRQFVQMLQDPSQPYLNVNEYAAHFMITPKYFSSICKRITGRTASQIINDEVTRTAQIMLRDSSKSIKQIAAKLSFKSQSHFGRFFRLHTGISPQQYRDGKNSLTNAHKTT